MAVVASSTTGEGSPSGPSRRIRRKSAAEIVLTVLHAGGKFGGSGYKVSGGLHGVGVSVVNALSRRLDLEIDRDGKHYEMSFEKGGHPTGPLHVTGDAPGGRTGTTVTFWPDETIFDEVEFRAQTVIERLQMMAFLNRDLEIRFTDERPEHEQEVKFHYAGGIEDFVRHLNESKEPLFRKVCYFEQSETDQEVEIALQWNESYNESIHSFANGISTIEGGMHEEGFKKALTNVVNRYARSEERAARSPTHNFQGEDIREGLTGDPLGATSRAPVRGSDQGQARQRLDSLARRADDEREARGVVRREPARSEPDRAKGACSPHGRGWRPARHATSPAASQRSTAPACPASSSTARRGLRQSPRSSSSRETRRPVRRNAAVIRGPRRSCRFAARS